MLIELGATNSSSPKTAAINLRGPLGPTTKGVRQKQIQVCCGSHCPVPHPTARGHSPMNKYVSAAVKKFWQNLENASANLQAKIGLPDPTR